MSKTFTIEKGRVVKVNGLPYTCLEDVQVSGWREPEWPVGPLAEPASCSANDCDHRGGAGVPTITRDTAPASGASLGSHVGGSMLTDDDKTEIDARITERISMFRETLIEQGQIQDVSLRGPSAIRPPSDCIQSARTHWGGQQEDPIPR
jgi:hypothetical protein